jgi:uncharacterized membrane protein YdjX (TVP38/TMEM64 family)
MAVPLLVLGAVARLATLDDAQASTNLLSRSDSWAWAVGILLIIADLVLPVPQASVITALGAIYGVALGTLIGTVGLILNGVAGYLLMWTPVRRVIERALKGRSTEAIAALSDRGGPWGIALSRSLPYSIPEAMVCLAGLASRLVWAVSRRRCSTPVSALAGLGIPSLHSPSATCSRLRRCRRCST